jgi:predicted MFS family arabinose efflux permease
MNAAAWTALIRDWRLMAAVAVTGLQMGGQFVVYTYIGPLLGATIGLTADGITAALIAFGVAGVFGGLAGGWIADRIGPFWSLAIILTAMAAGIGLLSVDPQSLPMTMIGLCLWAVFGFAVTTPQQSRLIAVGAHAQAIVLALNGSFLYIGTALGAAVGGVIVANSGYGALGWGGVALVALAVAALWISRTPGEARR